MKLYPKKLRSVRDLEKEKKLLRKQRRRIEEKAFSGKGGGAIPLLEDLSGANPLVSLIIKRVIRLFSEKKSKSAASAPSDDAEAKKPGVNWIKSIALEFIGGYLKWKAIELTYKGIRRYIRMQKEKKAE